ncbi:uncharacterized protein LOC128264337 [Drosophila gunungcola]|uniref:C2H2-type domain-containing protein n=1 Tax=Drosophila gunungcola TaxID=103775 RepID=A0A9P9YD88_9MUSC|nr:uncharacterized protein LOC128264337 [Drosophila gunungcola]KAI8034575.1 hypothetical protein M5D96_012628 [Drosophila gunungcola]
MNKPQKTTKVKRGKRHAHTHAHTHTHTRPKTQAQDLAAAEVENARKAVERKLIYLSESNRANAPIRPMKRGTGGAAVGGAGGVVSTGHGVHRRKHANKPPPQVPPKPPKIQEETSSQEKAEKYEKRTRGGYNVYLESPRRNGLTPRDYEAEAAQMAALLAAHRTSSGTTTKSGQQLKDEGKEGAQELGSYVQHHHHQLPSYSCRICGAMFHIRSLLGAHRYTHDDDFEARFRGRRQRDSSTILAAGSLCKFCDRKFDLERTLHIHQLSNCNQIPPQQRRKLAFTELAHEKKAPLPSFQRCSQHSRHSDHSDHSNHSNHSQRSHRRKMGNRSTTNIEAKQQRLHKTILQASAVHERWR